MSLVGLGLCGRSMTSQAVKEQSSVAAVTTVASSATALLLSSPSSLRLQHEMSVAGAVSDVFKSIG